VHIFKEFHTAEDGRVFKVCNDVNFEFPPEVYIGGDAPEKWKNALAGLGFRIKNAIKFILFGRVWFFNGGMCITTEELKKLLDTVAQVEQEMDEAALAELSKLHVGGAE
jgi:hypothetical protein